LWSLLIWSLLIGLWGGLRRRRLIGWLLRNGYCQTTQQKTGNECDANTSGKHESHEIDPPLRICAAHLHGRQKKQNKYC
jgi:hypothetical protein